MADYIGKNILIQAYIHIDKDLGTISEKELFQIQKKLTEFTKDRASFFLYPETDIEIEVQDGSIKSRITALGTVAALYGGIANYGSFREGVILIHSDAKRLVEFVISESMFEFRARATDSLRIEARVGVIGSLYKIVQKLEAIRSAPGDSDVRRLNGLLEGVSSDIERLMTALKNDDDRRLVADGLNETADRIPAAPRSPKKGEHPLQDITIYKQRRRKLLDTIKSQ